GVVPRTGEHPATGLLVEQTWCRKARIEQGVERAGVEVAGAGTRREAQGERCRRAARPTVVGEAAVPAGEVSVDVRSAARSAGGALDQHQRRPAVRRERALEIDQDTHPLGLLD